MKNNLILLGMLVIGFANAQVSPERQKLDTNYDTRIGINTSSPQASLDVKELLNGNIPIDARIQGISLPNFTTEQREKFGEEQTESMKIGTLIYNTTKKCIEMYKGYYDGEHQWSCDLSGGAIGEDFYISLIHRPFTCKQFGELDLNGINSTLVVRKDMTGGGCYNGELYNKFSTKRVISDYVISTHTALNYVLECYRRLAGAEIVISTDEHLEKHLRNDKPVRCIGNEVSHQEIYELHLPRRCYDIVIETIVTGDSSILGLCAVDYWTYKDKSRNYFVEFYPH